MKSTQSGTTQRRTEKVYQLANKYGFFVFRSFLEFRSFWGFPSRKMNAFESTQDDAMNN